MVDRDAEPLIRSSEDGDDNGHALRHPELTRRESPDDNEYDGRGSHESDASGGETTPSLFVWVLTAVAGLSGLLFGYDTGVISSTLVSIHKSLSHRELTTIDKSVITSATSLFALIASPCTGFLADRVGRKRAIVLASILFVLGALGQAISTSVNGMIVGRSVVGLGVGSASFVVPLYISELSPSRWRGRLVTIQSLFITGGQVVAYVVGWLFSHQQNGWRWMVGLGAVPAALQLALLAGMPETPRWLVKVGRRADAEAVLRKVYGSTVGKGGAVTGVLRSIQREIDEEEAIKRSSSSSSTSTTPFTELFTVGGNRRALAIACLLQASQQLCGFNSLMYFSATIFALVGFTSPTLTSLSVATTNFIFTVVAFFSIDRIGRRRILLNSIPFMVIGLGLCAFAFVFIDIRSMRPPAYHLLSTREPAKAHIQWAPGLLLGSLILYIAAYALGLGCVPWQQSELFPLRVRSIGASLSTATNWLSNTIVGLTFLPMLEALTPQVTFACYAAVCFAAWLGVRRCYPETAGLGLEDVGRLLERDWGVKESVKQWEERRKQR